jgi:hypothetical protein
MVMNGLLETVLGLANQVLGAVVGLLSALL